MFCRQCGQKFEDNQKFCANCGAKFSGEKSSLQETTRVDTSETVLNAFPASLKLGIFKSQMCMLVFTKSKLIVSIVSKEMQKKAMKEAKGYFNKMGAMYSFLDKKRYLEMTPQDVLTENTSNFEIGFGHVSGIKYKKSTYSYDHETGADSSSQGVLKIEYSGNKLKALLGGYGGKMDFEKEFIEFMIDTFGKRFKY